MKMVIKTETVIRSATFIGTGTLIRTGIVIRSEKKIVKLTVIVTGTVYRTGTVIRTGTIIGKGTVIKTGIVIRSRKMIAKGTVIRTGTVIKTETVIPRKKPLQNFRPPENVIVVYDSSGNFNENVINESIIQRVLVPYKLAENLAELNLVLDQAPCHSTKKLVKESFVENKINPTLGPNRLTGLLQPGDISWMKPLKTAYQKILVRLAYKFTQIIYKSRKLLIPRIRSDH